MSRRINERRQRVSWDLRDIPDKFARRSDLWFYVDLRSNIEFQIGLYSNSFRCCKSGNFGRSYETLVQTRSY